MVHILFFNLFQMNFLEGRINSFFILARRFLVDYVFLYIDQFSSWSSSNVVNAY